MQLVVPVNLFIIYLFSFLAYGRCDIIIKTWIQRFFLVCLLKK